MVPVSPTSAFEQASACRRTRRAVAVLLVLVIVAAALWWLRGDDEPERPDWSALPAVVPHVPSPVDIGVVEPPAQRTWRLAQLDPCALATIDRAQVRHIYRPAPLDCQVDGALSRVEVGIDFTTLGQGLHLRTRRDFAGHAGWVGALEQGGCDVVLPAGRHATLTFTASDLSGCGRLGRHVRRVLRRWDREPRSLAPERALPHACQLAAHAGLSTAARGPRASGMTCDLGKGRQVVVAFDEDGRLGDDVAQTVADQRVVRSEEYAETWGSDGCSYRWPSGAPVTNVEYWEDGRADPTYDDDLLVSVAAPTCGAARRMAARLVPAAATWRTPQAPRPREVLYRYDRPDHTGTGPCAHVLHQADERCAPYNERVVPQDPIDFLRHGEADPDVVCTLALPVAREHLPSAEAVTAGHHHRTCVLVDPSHDFSIVVRASRDAIGAGAEHEIAGHPTRRLSDTLWEVALTRPEDRGHLVVSLTTYRGAAPAWVADFVEGLTRQALD